MLGLTFFATPSFFRHKKKLRRIEHLQDQGFISSELYFSKKIEAQWNSTTVGLLQRSLADSRA